MSDCSCQLGVHYSIALFHCWNTSISLTQMSTHQLSISITSVSITMADSKHWASMPQARNHRFTSARSQIHNGSRGKIFTNTIQINIISLSQEDKIGNIAGVPSSLALNNSRIINSIKFCFQIKTSFGFAEDKFFINIFYRNSNIWNSKYALFTSIFFKIVFES